MLYNSMEDLIGNTPLVALKKISSSANILAKLESRNPGGSAKDRIALAMILDAEEKGLLKAGGTIIEPTSGNTGIGLCAVAAARGYRCIIVMPDTMSVERQKLVAAYGGEVVLTPGAEGMTGAIAKAQALAEEIEGSLVAGQFTNPANPAAHYKTTGPEIWQDTEGKVDIFVAGIGTGGTISGVGRYLKEKNPDIRIVGIEPADSPLLSEGRSGSHKLQGIGANFVPDTLNRSILDEVLTVTTEEAYAAARRLGREEGLLGGISSGAALHGAMVLAQRPENKGKNIVVLLPDSGERYLSTDLY
jgi:cysteine synthase A